MTLLLKRPGQVLWFAVLGALVLAAAGTGGYALVAGHEHVYNVNRGIPWGILIANYVFMAVTCSGLCMISSLGHVFGFRNFETISRRAILMAILCLMGGFFSIGMDLEHPLNMIYTLLSPNFSSAIWWMGTIYGCYLLVLLAEFYFLMTNNHRMSMVSGTVGFLLAIAAPSVLGSVFGLALARPFWHGSFLPVYIIITALVSGTALITLVLYFHHTVRGIEFSKEEKGLIRLLGKILAMLLFILMFSVFWSGIVGLYGHEPGRYQPVMSLLTGSLSVDFWLFELLIGLAIPLYLLMRHNRTPFGTMIASLLALIGMFVMRFDMTIGGQLYPLRAHAAGLTNGLFTYFPSAGEIIIVVGSIAFSLMVYTLAEKFLDLDVKVEGH
jgi:Ni/Fe-hydrogenase subunit HybB-like protein